MTTLHRIAGIVSDHSSGFLLGGALALVAYAGRIALMMGAP